ncbi:aminoglycoside phosphotransferase family protein [Riemerella columbipharyngis]|uniref:Phosphotransferase enzyme family protein n=1 Tax=Riemerella columbipharyngis TaxID=1071918 RepID=A0A1G7F3Z4_9FLAO|nr:aminoglycoside phosphotransferase family protein [Riemerella columbipharyngis]SDE70611.1 Phosphotransferase enzyme family protein [Riemerella columbipharyngis]
MSVQSAKLFFRNSINEEITAFSTLPASGSSRVNYFVETTENKYIVTENENLRENHAFFYFSEIFSNLGLNTPRISAVSEDETIYIQSYLGSRTLSDIISKNPPYETIEALTKSVLDNLYTLQIKTQGKINYRNTFEYESYTELPVTHDLYYFKNFFIDVLEIPYHKSTLLKEFKNIVSLIEHLSPKGLMLRDFQSRNIMIDDSNNNFFIDYQSAMYGPLMYDIISFLYQAKANFQEDFRLKMIDYYIEKFPKEEQISLSESINPIKLIRFMQVLGAYGFRGIIQRKPHFLNSIKLGVENIQNFSASWDGIKKFPELVRLISRLKFEEISKKLNL